MTKQRQKIQIYPTQAQFLDSQAMLRGFVGGRGTGKSFVGAYDLMRRAKPGRTYMIVAPTYPMLRDASLKTFLELGRKLKFLRGFAKADMYATLGNDATILFRSADNPNRLRGSNLSGVWMDEAGEIEREAFDIVIACLRENREKGWLSATFTPRGRSHWTYSVFGNNTDGAQLFHARTDENPFLPADFYESIKSQYTGLRAAQELGGQFVEIDGAEWGAEFFGDWIWCPVDRWPSDFDCRVLCVDPSKGKSDKQGDYTAIVFMGIHNGLLYVDAELERIPLNQLVHHILRWCDRCKPDFVGVESEQFQELIIHELRRQCGERFAIQWPWYQMMTKGIPKVARIRRLTQYLVNRELRFKADSPGCRLLVDQMTDFPLADHDDGPDALEMCVRLPLEASS